MPNSWVEVDVAGQVMDSYLTRPEAEGRYPAVLVIQEILGVNSHIQGVTDRFPSQGYVALAPSMFHREGRMTIGLHEEMQTANDRMGRCTDDNIIADVTAAMEYLKAQPFVNADQIGIVGFCFGGRVAYLAASTVPDLKATTVFYGGGILQARGDGPSPLERTADINSPVLGLFGEHDQNPTPADVETIRAELQRLGKTFEFHSYPGCGHGFHCDARPSYRPQPAQDAWRRTMAWFQTHLKGPTGPRDFYLPER